MGKSSSTTVGYHYRVAFQVGLTLPIDAFLGMRASDKDAWSGKITASARIQINAPQLFGGEKDQGGIVGPIDVMFGESGQMPNAYLQSIFGEQTVAWRGFTTVAFCGGRYGAMNPMPHKPAWKICKILAGWDNDDPWYPETAVIPYSTSDEAPGNRIEWFYYFAASAIMPSPTGVDWGLPLIDAPNLNAVDLLRWGSLVVAIGGVTSAYFADRGSLDTWTALPNLPVTRIGVHGRPVAINGRLWVPMGGGAGAPEHPGAAYLDSISGAWVTIPQETHPDAANTPVTTVILPGAGFILRGGTRVFHRSVDGGASWAPGGLATISFIVRTGDSDGVRICVAGQDSATDRPEIWVTDNGLSFTKAHTPQGLTGTVYQVLHVEGSTWLAFTSAGLWRSVDKGARWLPVDLGDSVSFSQSGWGNGDKNPRNGMVLCAGEVDDQWVIFGSFDAGESWPFRHVVQGNNQPYLVWLGVGGEHQAMNPAHTLYYIRTGAEKGREPRANMNVASFTAAANRLYTEGFGLCWEYDPQQDTPDSFSERICQIIGGSCERSVVDGQWYLDLARGDYNVATLPIIDDNHILDFRELPSTLDNVVNSVAVRYFDPERKESIITPAVRALGLIRRFGEIHETLDFPEIPTAALALRRAEMELRARITPTRTFEITTHPKVPELRKNTYFRLQSPRRRIAEMVCIVGERQAGSLKSGAIRWKVSQDIYSLPQTTYADIEHGDDPGLNEDPDPITHQQVFEAPYINVAAAIPPAELEALPEDAGFVIAVAAQPTNGRDFTVTVSAGGAFQPVVYGDWCPTALTDGAVEREEGPTEVAIRDAQGLASVTVGSAVLLGSEICRVDYVDLAASSVLLGRGCADTLPAAHVDGTRLWFYGVGGAADPTQYSEGETLLVQLLTNNGGRQLLPSEAETLSLVLEGRAIRPYPPAGLRIDAEAAPTSVAGDFVVTWANRDRIQQADQLVDATLGSIGPELTGRTALRLLDASAELLVEKLDIAGATATVDLAYTGDVTLEIYAINDYGASLRKHAITFAYTAGSATEHVITADTYDPPYRIIDGGEIT